MSKNTDLNDLKDDDIKTENPELSELDKDVESNKKSEVGESVVKDDRKFFSSLCLKIVEILFIPLFIVAIISAVTMATAKAHNKMPSILGNSIVTVLTNSMEPNYGVGSILLIDQGVRPDSIEVGMPIAFYAPINSGFIDNNGNSLVVFHRVVRIIYATNSKGNLVRYFVCHGDNSGALRYTNVGEGNGDYIYNSQTKKYELSKNGNFVVSLYNDTESTLSLSYTVSRINQINQSSLQYVTDNFVVGTLKLKVGGIFTDIIKFMTSSSGITALVIIPCGAMIAIIIMNMISDSKEEEEEAKALAGEQSDVNIQIDDNKMQVYAIETAENTDTGKLQEEDVGTTEEVPKKKKYGKKQKLQLSDEVVEDTNVETSEVKEEPIVEAKEEQTTEVKQEPIKEKAEEVEKEEKPKKTKKGLGLFKKKEKDVKNEEVAEITQTEPAKEEVKEEKVKKPRKTKVVPIIKPQEEEKITNDILLEDLSNDKIDNNEEVVEETINTNTKPKKTKRSLAVVINKDKKEAVKDKPAKENNLNIQAEIDSENVDKESEKSDLNIGIQTEDDKPKSKRRLRVKNVNLDNKKQSKNSKQSEDIDVDLNLNKGPRVKKRVMERNVDLDIDANIKVNAKRNPSSRPIYIYLKKQGIKKRRLKKVPKTETSEISEVESKPKKTKK